MRLKIVVNGRDGFTPEMIEKHDTAARLCEDAVNSVDFKEMVLNKLFTNSKGMTSASIYESLMTGKETLDMSDDKEADVHVVAYHKNNSVVGYTYSYTHKTYVNTKFFNSYDYSGIAGNLWHEWTHKAGWDHSSAKDHDSVPYATGYIVEDLVKKLMAGERLDQIDGSMSAPYAKEPVPYPVKTLVCYRSWRTLWRKKCYYKESV